MVVRNAQPALNTHTHLPIGYWQPLYWILAAFSLIIKALFVELPGMQHMVLASSAASRRIHRWVGCWDIVQAS